MRLDAPDVLPETVDPYALSKWTHRVVDSPALIYRPGHVGCDDVVNTSKAMLFRREGLRYKGLLELQQPYINNTRWSCGPENVGGEMRVNTRLHVGRNEAHRDDYGHASGSHMPQVVFDSCRDSCGALLRTTQLLGGQIIYDPHVTPSVHTPVTVRMAARVNLPNEQPGWTGPMLISEATNDAGNTPHAVLQAAMDLLAYQVQQIGVEKVIAEIDT